MADVTTDFDFSAARIAIVGGGYMGRAMLEGFLGSERGVGAQLHADNFCVVNRGEEKRASIMRAYGVECLEDVSLLRDCDIVILTVPPEAVFGVLEVLRETDFASRALFISPASGIATSSIEAMLPEGANVVRVMPSMSIAAGESALPCVQGARATEASARMAQELFSSVGYVFPIEERLMDPATSLSACGCGLFALMLQAMGAAGAEMGLDYDLAEVLARDTMEGVARYMRAKDRSAEDVRVSVNLAGSASRAAMNALREQDFDGVIRSTMATSLLRLIEMRDTLAE